MAKLFYTPGQQADAPGCRAAGAVSDHSIAEEGVPGFSYIGWIGAVAKVGTPQPIINAINKVALGVIKSPAVQKALSTDGSAAAYNSPEQFRLVIDSALDRVDQLIKQTGLKLEDNR